MHEFFRQFARRSAKILGSAEVFLVALVTILIWAALGPHYHYSDTWQLVINTATSVLTFLMVFVIQNTQNRDSKAIQLKLDELLRGVQGARTGLVRLEDLTDAELQALTGDFERLRARLANAGHGPGAEPLPTRLRDEEPTTPEESADHGARPEGASLTHVSTPHAQRRNRT
jgi:low affinity Fe/Cu permease